MRVKYNDKEGRTLKTIDKKHKQTANEDLILFAVIVAFLIILLPSSLQAQEAPQSSTTESKPHLVSISNLLETNDDKALAVAKVLDPDFFITDEENFGSDAKFSAQFLSIDKNNPKRFIALTVSNTNYYCTTYGCPYYIYQRRSENKWSLVLSVQALSLLYDKNTNTGTVNNIISQSIEQAQTKIDVWIWNGQFFKRVEK